MTAPDATPAPARDPDRSRGPDLDAILAAKPPRRGRIWALRGIALAALAGGVWFWQTGPQTPAAALYDLALARIAPVTVTVTATGTVESTNLVEISSELSGIVRSVDADFNDIVTRGQVLARLDTAKLEAAVARERATLAARRARLAEAQATVDEAGDTFDRMIEMDRRGIATHADFLSAKAAQARAIAAAATAEADIRVVEADLTLDEVNLKSATIVSPIDGIVLSRNVDVGQIVASALQAPVLFTLAEDLTQMELHVDVDEADIGDVAVGHDARFTVEAYQGQVFPAVIAQLRYAPQIIDGVVTYTAVLSIDNGDLRLRPGMTATAEITVAEIPAILTVPNAALRFAPPAEEEAASGGSGLLGMLIRPRTAAPPAPPAAGPGGTRTIWTLRGGVLTPVKVAVGRSDGSVTAILSGELEIGDQVVTGLAAQ